MRPLVHTGSLSRNMKWKTVDGKLWDDSPMQLCHSLCVTQVAQTISQHPFILLSAVRHHESTVAYSTPPRNTTRVQLYSPLTTIYLPIYLCLDLANLYFRAPVWIKFPLHFLQLMLEQTYLTIKQKLYNIALPLKHSYPFPVWQAHFSFHKDTKVFS